MSVLDIAQQRKGKLRDGYSTNKAGASEAKTRVEYGTAQGDSSNGFVEILIDNSDESFEVACDAPISSGDRVAYISTNGNGKAVSVSTLSTIASDASAIANATNQYFWADSNGIHVSTDAEQPAGTRNILINSIGILLRKAANYLVSLTAGAVEFYDGDGNAASNRMAKIGSDGIEFKTKDTNNPTQTYGTFTISPTGEINSLGRENNLDYQTHIAPDGIYLVDDQFTTLEVGYLGFEYDNGHPVLYTDQNNYGSLYYRDYDDTGTDIGLPIFKIATYSYTTPSTAVSSGGNVTNAALSSVPSGYKAIAIASIGSNHGQNWYVGGASINVANRTISYSYKHAFGSGSETCTFNFYLLCVPSANVG